LTELCSLSDKLKLEVYDMILNGDQALSYRIERTPATVVLGERDYGIRFYGLTMGHEFTSLLEALLMVSSGQSSLDPELEPLVKGLSEKVHLQILVTLTCPYCPRMVHLAQQFALVNPNIQADMVEVGEFTDVALRYNVTGVPKTIINEAHSFEGAVTAWALYLEILKAVNPGEYIRLEEQIREAQGTRRIRKIEEDHDYDIIVVGAGPAAMSAATYAARKGLDVALIGKLLGGQVNYTASIENYLGIPAISGADLTESFRTHLESMPIALDAGITVTQVQKQDHHFLVSAEGNHQFKALALIYCAGKEYRRLGVPGEEQFIGKGIGFCATCDAPLYRGRRVAVVGGGNSAFTAARDLIAFATEIHLVHRRKEFRADALLVEEAQAAKNVVFHTPMEIRHSSAVTGSQASPSSPLMARSGQIWR